MPIDHDTADYLLRLGVVDTGRPVNLLLERLETDPDQSWLREALAGLPGLGGRDVETMFLDGAASVEELQAVKDDAKRLMKIASDPNDRAVALAGYFVTTAAALAHHREKISSGVRKELSNAILDLAAATTGRWQELFTEAARTFIG